MCAECGELCLRMRGLAGRSSAVRSRQTFHTRRLPTASPGDAAGVAAACYGVLEAAFAGAPCKSGKRNGQTSGVQAWYTIGSAHARRLVPSNTAFMKLLAMPMRHMTHSAACYACLSQDGIQRKRSLKRALIRTCQSNMGLTHTLRAMHTLCVLAPRVLARGFCPFPASWTSRHGKS